MKIKSLILAMAACAGLFSACSNELLEEVPPEVILPVETKEMAKKKDLVWKIK